MYAPPVTTVKVAATVDTVGSAGVDCWMMLPAVEAFCMQAVGAADGATQMLKVPMPAAAFGVPMTRSVNCPTAAGSVNVAEAAGASRLTMATMAAP